MGEEAFERLRRMVLRRLSAAGVDALIEDERTRLCGPRHAHMRDGRTPSSLRIGGRRVSVARPCVLDGARTELPLAG